MVSKMVRFIRTLEFIGKKEVLEQEHSQVYLPFGRNKLMTW